MGKAKIEIIKDDLKWQLGFEHIDWDYFIDMAKQGQELEKKLQTKTIRKK